MPAATIMFLDIVGFSRNPNSRQRELVDSLTSEVTSGLSSLINPPLETPHVVAMPTGDGMALAFLHQPNQPWDISTIMSLIYRVEGWAKSKAIALRTGVHSGEVEFIADINNKTNIVGDTINYAQRVMDAANPKQVLFSDTAFRQYIGSNTPSYSAPPYSPECKAVFEGPFEVQAKHGMRMLIYKMTLDPPQEWLSNDDPVTRKIATVEPTLLTTKLFIPPARPGLVARPRLMECLQSALSCGLILVSAPAGFGKTTLVSEWVRRNKDKTGIAWVSLDEGDNDPVRFWDYFIAALRTIKPTAGETALSLLHSPQPYPTESVLTALINDVTAIPDDFAVILDDYHLIKAEAIQQGLTFLLDHLPPRMHLVIATRTDPPLPLAHFRGRGTMLEIEADDLRFTEQEAAGLFKGLAAEDIGALNERTEGWVTGLRMAALSLGQRKDVKSFIDRFTGSQRYVTDYLVEEVLKNQSDEIRGFLLKTSVLERLSAPLCDVLTGHGNGQEMLEKLESFLEGFLVPLDESREWYRYHHLFAELLRHQLELKSGSEEVTALHQRASQWYEDNQFPDDAIHLALVAKDWERAVRLISGVAEVRIQHGEMITLLGWLQSMPEEVLRTDLHLYRQYSHTLVQTGQIEAAETALSYLEKTASVDANMQGEVAAEQADLARRRGDIHRTTELARKALALLPPGSLALRGRASHILGLNLYEIGLYDEAWLMFTNAFEMGSQMEDRVGAVEAQAYMARILRNRGRLQKALELSQQAIDMAGQSPAALSPRHVLDLILYEWNDLEAAAYDQENYAELGELRGNPEYHVSWYIFLGRTRLAQGNSIATHAALAKAHGLIDHSAIRPGIRAQSVAYEALMALRQDDLVAALKWGERLSQYAGVLPFPIRHFPARLKIARGEKADAAVELQDCYQKVARVEAKGPMIEIRIYQALASEKPVEALTFLADALKMGQPEGFIRTFVDEGKLLAPLLREALAQGITPEYTGKLLNIIEAEERQRMVR